MCFNICYSRATVRIVSICHKLHYSWSRNSISSFFFFAKAAQSRHHYCSSILVSFVLYKICLLSFFALLLWLSGSFTWVNLCWVP
jgi:hypothetical protein